MGGVIRNLTLHNLDQATDPDLPGVIRLRDEDITFDPHPYPKDWLFGDFDRIFALLGAASGTRTSDYDIFGHSAGGQILHRLALFRPASKARRIVAANAGFYTLPDLDRPLLTGLEGAGLTQAALVRALAAPLTVFLGEDDDSDRAGGTLLHTPLVDEQGPGRLSRGRTFFAAGRARAQALGVPFGWTLQTVPDVGHDFRGMSRAAARLLYG